MFGLLEGMRGCPSPAGTARGGTRREAGQGPRGRWQTPPADGMWVTTRCTLQYWPVVAVIKDTISLHGERGEMI